MTLQKLIEELQEHARTTGSTMSVRVRIMRGNVTIESVAKDADEVFIVAAANWTPPRKGSEL